MIIHAFIFFMPEIFQNKEYVIINEGRRRFRRVLSKSKLLVIWNRVGKGNGNPLQYSCLKNPVARGAWWAAVYRVAYSRTWLKRLSMHACIGEGNGNPVQYSCLENPRDRGAWWAAIYGVTQSPTLLKWLSSSSSSRTSYLKCTLNYNWPVL